MKQLLGVLVLCIGFYVLGGFLLSASPSPTDLSLGLAPLAEAQQNSFLGDSTRTNARTVGVSDGLQGYIIAFGYFINYTLIPLLIGLALLVFIYNTVKYFINNANIEKRDEAKRHALYGVAAFVAIVSIWGIVNLLVGGFDIDREESICPDFLGSWCGNTGFGSYSRNTQTNPLQTGGSSSGGSRIPVSGSGSGSGGAVSSGGSNTVSPLANLLFGAQQDHADFSFRSGPPRAQTNTVLLAENSTCSAGFDTLRLAADVENNQAAFVLYTSAAGATLWKNITDEHSATGIGYDADVLNDLSAAGATDIHIVQVHPKQQTLDAGLSMDGHGPSQADHLQLCDSTANDATFITVDWTGVWESTQPTGACPRRADEEDDLITVDALTAVAMITSSQREYEWDRMLASDLTPSRHLSSLDDFASTAFNTMSTDAILRLAQPYEDTARIDQVRTSVSAICSGF